MSGFALQRIRRESGVLPESTSRLRVRLDPAGGPEAHRDYHGSNGRSVCATSCPEQPQHTLLVTLLPDFEAHHLHQGARSSP
jgi:hypothetical protein